MFKNRTKFL